MKNILVLIHDDAGQEARFQAALDVTRGLEGHLTCLDVVLLPTVVGDTYVADNLAVLLGEEQEREAANRTRMTARLEREDVAWNWLDATGDMAACLADAAGLADLIVVSRRLDKIGPDMRGVAGDVLLKARKPILAVPEGVNRLDVGGRALVAWNGSPRSMAALTAAAPLLRLARDVVLLEIDDGSLEGAAEEAARYLSRHGIKAQLRREPARPGDAAALLLDWAREGFDYIVMGGFGHSRFAEALFSGVTRKMLTESPVPLLLAH